MTEPVLYHEYDWNQAVAEFGAIEQAHVLCDGQWVIFPKVILCLTVLGEPPSMPHFEAASRFWWASENQKIPKRVIAGENRRPTIHFFVRATSNEKFIYLGKSGPSHQQSYPCSKEYVAAQFDLRPAIPSRIWQSLGGFSPGDLNHASVAASLQRLQGDTTTDERFQVLQDVVEYWHGTIGSNDGLSEQELGTIEMPLLLRRWYRFAGRRKEIMSGQNFLLEPGNLKIKKGLLNFYGENQWVYEWAASLSDDDPPVYGRWEESEPWQPEGILLSEFLIQVCLFEAILCHSRYGASSAWISEDAMAEIRKHIQPLPIATWRWCDQEFWSGDGVYALVSDNGENQGQQSYGIWFGAKTEYPLEFLRPIVSDGWDFVSL